VCASGMSVDGSNFRVTNSWFAYNGWPGDETDPQIGEPWSDGLTVLSCNDGSIIESNHFVDNTDVDLIVGGGSGCLITDNHIDHYQTRGFAGLMVESFNGAGDHSGITYSGNTVTSTLDQLAFGIMVGHHPWTSQLNILNVGSVQGNTASGAVINLQIEASSGIAGGQVTGNTVSGAAGTSTGGFFRCAIVTNYAVYEPHAVGIVYDVGYEVVQFDSQQCNRVQ
jgi:hypothetical protein